MSIEERFNELRNRMIGLPYVGVLLRAGNKGHVDRGKDMAASIAYFTFLSLFPLVLGLVSLGGFVLKSEEVQLRVNQLIVEMLPVSAELVTRITSSVVEIRGAAGLTSILILIWSASKMVGALSRAINVALGQKRHYALYLSPLRYFALTLVVAILIVLTLAVSPLLEVLSELQLEFIGERWNSVIGIVAGRAAGLAVTLLLVSVIYTLAPYRRINFADLLPGIVVAVFLIEAGKSLFVWYVGTAADYNAVYGSLSSIIVLLIWLYFSARAVLYGAEVIHASMQSPK